MTNTDNKKLPYDLDMHDFKIDPDDPKQMEILKRHHELMRKLEQKWEDAYLLDRYLKTNRIVIRH